MDQQIAYDLERIQSIAHEGLRQAREQKDEENVEEGSLALDTFSIVAVFGYRTDQDEEREATAVWSESRRRHVQLGVLDAGQERLAGLLDPDD